MKMNSIPIAMSVFSIVAVGGCAQAPDDGGFRDVQRVSLQRTGALVQWDQHGSADQAVRVSIRSMLAQELTADRAVQIALLHNQNLQATFQDLGIAQADLVQAGLLQNPVFDLGVRLPTRRPYKTYVDVDVTEDFISVFFIPLRKRIAGAQLEAVKARVTTEILALAADTKGAFYTAQAAEQLVELGRTVASATSAAANAAKRLHDAGNNTDLELANARAQDARAQLDLASAEADAADARERLSALMGLWGSDTAWTLGNHLPDLPAIEVNPIGLEQLAIRQRTDLDAAGREVEVERQALGFTSQTRWLTQGNIGAQAERETDGQWRIGPSLSVPIPLFDQGQAAVPRAQAVLVQSEQRYWALAVEIRTQVRSARNRLLSARAKVELYRDKLLPIQRQVVAQTQLEYNGMLTGVFQLLQARRDQIDAARDSIESLRAYWLARVALERAVGGRLMADPPNRPSTAPATPLQ